MSPMFETLLIFLQYSLECSYAIISKGVTGLDIEAGGAYAIVKQFLLC